MKGGGALALLALGGLFALGGGGRRTDRTADAARALRASDDEARRAEFVPQQTPRGRVILPTEEQIERVSGASMRDPRRARSLAGPLARALRRDGAQPMQRRDVSAFQAAAGLVPHGRYDESTRRELARYGVRNAPPAFFADEGA